MEFDKIKELLSTHIYDNVYGLFNLYSKDQKAAKFSSYFKIKVDSLSRDPSLGKSFLNSILLKNETDYKSEAELALSITEFLIGTPNMNKNSMKSNLDYTYSICKKLYINTMKDLSDIYCDSIDRNVVGVDDSVRKFILDKTNSYFNCIKVKYDPYCEVDYKAKYEELLERYNRLTQEEEEFTNNVFDN